MTSEGLPTQPRTAQNPVVVPSATIDRLAETSLLSLEGTFVRLGDLWRDRPAALLYLRHYGCQFCKEEAATYRASLTRIEARGSFAAVGLGSLEQSRDFHATYGEGLPALIDFSKATYEALGFERSARRAYGLRAVVSTVSAIGKGFYPGAPQGDPFQLGGIFVVRAGGAGASVYRSAYAGDHLSVERTLELMER